MSNQSNRYHYVQWCPKSRVNKAFDGVNAVWVNVQKNDVGDWEQAPKAPTLKPIKPVLERM